jgi:hypothetical protein
MFHLHRAIEDRDRRWRLIEIDPDCSVRNRRDQLSTGVNHVEVLGGCAQLCVDEPMQDNHLGMKVFGWIDAQGIQSQSAVGRQTYKTAVLKLNLGLAIFASRQARAFSKRHVDLRGVARRVIQMIDSHVARQVAKPGRTVGRSIIRSRLESRCRKKKNQGQSGDKILTPLTSERERSHDILPAQ